MNRRSWKYRIEAFRVLSPEDKVDILRGNCSAKLAKWAYKNHPDDFSIRVESLRAIANDADSPWSKRFLLNELEDHKNNEFGDWVVMILTESYLCRQSEIPIFIELYENPSAHPEARGCCLFALNYIVESAKWQNQHIELNPLKDICSRALYDEDNPYARAGAVWLANQLNIFGDRCKELLSDHTVCNGGLKVSDYAEMVLE